MLKFVMEIEFIEDKDFSMKDAIELLQTRLEGLQDLKLSTKQILIVKP